jgi:GNAT superfamily N-acetyltransferase
LETVVDLCPSADESLAIQQNIVAFGDAHVPPRNYRPVHIVLRSEDGRLLGGLLGSMVWEWLQIDVLWVDEAVRGKSYGSLLLRQVERLAWDAGCQYVRLDTFDFEARGFYEKHGYRVYGELQGFPRGHTQFHLKKTLPTQSTKHS